MGASAPNAPHRVQAKTLRRRCATARVRENIHLRL